METALHAKTRPLADTLTVAAIAALAYLLATALHEHAGHALACVALGGRVSELGAFYADCDYRQMGSLGVRLVALAGPAVSLLTGLLALAGFRAAPASRPHLRFALWLLGSVGLFAASGYPLFSGVAGIGDFGSGPDGAIRGLEPEWLWRIALIAVGALAYWQSMRASLRAMERLIGGSGRDRVARAQRLALTSYVAGGVVSVAVGLLNPVGIFIVLASAGASSLGGTSALAWGMQFMDRARETDDPPLELARDWRWAAAGALATLLYAAVFGPSIRP